jgi:replicative DNA helicase
MTPPDHLGAADLPLRTPPQNLEAEQALLGAVLINNDAIERVSDFLEAQHFFDPLHQQIYETAAKLIASGKQATPITLKTFFASAEPIEPTLTVPQYLAQLAANAATIINARDYGRIIRDLAIRRALILIGEDVVNTAYDSPVDFRPREQIEEAEARLFALAERGESEEGPASFATADAEAMAAARERHMRKSVGLTCRSISDVHEKMGGFHASNLIILASQPSMGKTAFAINNVAYDIAVSGTRVLVFSLEMSRAELADRIICARAGVPVEKVRKGRLSDDEFDRYGRAAAELDTLPLDIDHTGGISIAQLTARARRHKRRAAFGLLIVDYLQLMTAPGGAQRQSCARGLAHFEWAQGAGEGVARASPCAFAAVARGRASLRQPPADG